MRGHLGKHRRGVEDDWAGVGCVVGARAVCYTVPSAMASQSRRTAPRARRARAPRRRGVLARRARAAGTESRERLRDARTARAANGRGDIFAIIECYIVLHRVWTPYRTP